MLDTGLLVSGVLFTTTVAAAILYYRQIRKVGERYEEARDLVGDIVLSFNRQVEGYERQLDNLRKQTDMLSSAHTKTMAEVGRLRKSVRQFATEVNIDTVSEIEEEVWTQIQEVNRRLESLETALGEIEGKMVKVERLRKQVPVERGVQTPKIETPIPIKTEKALAPLTETELSILRILAQEGPKTSPEIREKIDLTREHTARLMKKLYEDGYLERSTQKIPFTYRIKKEMLNILERQT